MQEQRCNTFSGVGCQVGVNDSCLLNNLHEDLSGDELHENISGNSEMNSANFEVPRMNDDDRNNQERSAEMQPLDCMNGDPFLNLLSYVPVPNTQDTLAVNDLNPHSVHDLEQSLGLKFSRGYCLCRDMNCTSTHADCLHSSSVAEYMNMNLSGHTVYLNVPYGVRDIDKISKHYFRCKESAPDSTCACIVIPKYYGRRHNFQASLQLLGTMKVNSLCHTACGDAVRRSEGLEMMDIWYDPHQRVEVSSALYTKPLSSVIPVRVSGHLSTLFFDTGATHKFISRTFAEKYGLNVRPATASVHCAGSTEVKTVSHIVTARLHMQSLKCDESFLVMDLPPGLDACLGDSWLAKHHALWSYEHKCLRLKRGKEWCMIKFDMNDDDVNEMDDDLPPPPRQGVPLLSAVQVKSMMKEPGSRYFLLNVTVLSDNDETGERKVLIDEVLAGYESVFDKMKTCPPHRSVSHVIDTGDHGPVSLPMHRLSPKEKVEVERQVQELLVKGLIQPSNSPYGAPVLFVQKKD